MVRNDKPPDLYAMISVDIHTEIKKKNIAREKNDDAKEKQQRAYRLKSFQCLPFISMEDLSPRIW